MNDRPVNKGRATGAKVSGLHGRSRNPDGMIQHQRGDVLGLGAFEKISAVEGIRPSGEMRKDLRSLNTRPMDESQRSRFITGTYGKK